MFLDICSTNTNKWRDACRDSPRQKDDHHSEVRTAEIPTASEHPEVRSDTNDTEQCSTVRLSKSCDVSPSPLS